MNMCGARMKGHRLKEKLRGHGGNRKAGRVCADLGEQGRGGPLCLKVTKEPGRGRRWKILESNGTVKRVLL